MFAKIFSQIFDSSIAENHLHRHVFMDLLVLADIDGVVDMTLEAIARRTNVPVQDVRDAIEALCTPDQSSRTKEADGRRLFPVDAGRDWGWQIVSYQHYRAVRDDEARRQYHRSYYLEKRAKKKANGNTIRPERREDGGKKKQGFKKRDPDLPDPRSTMTPRAPDL